MKSPVRSHLLSETPLTMRLFASLSSLAPLLAASLLLAACAGEAAEADLAADESAATAARVKLPEDDRCRDVLGPLALALGDGASGAAVTASLVSSTEVRVYALSVARGTSRFRYTAELDNDSASRCLLLSVKLDHDAVLGADPRTSATPAELAPLGPVNVPAEDVCASTVSLLAQAAAVSAVGRSGLVAGDVTLVGADEDRTYDARLDGRDFTVGAATFSNDWAYRFELSNDSAFKCVVHDVTLR